MRKAKDSRRLAEARQAKVWKRRWMENPELMERARAKATKAAAERWRLKNDSLRQIVSQWPKEMTRGELDTRIARVYPSQRNPRSLFNRLIRLGFIRYNGQSDAWSNLCHIEQP